MTEAIAGPHEVRIGSGEAMAQARGLAGRSIRGTLRQPTVWLPGAAVPDVHRRREQLDDGQGHRLRPRLEGVPSLLEFLLWRPRSRSRCCSAALTAGSDTATRHPDRVLRPTARVAGVAHDDPGRPAGRRLRDAGRCRPWCSSSSTASSGSGRRPGMPGMLLLVDLRHGARARHRRVRRDAGAAHRGRPRRCRTCSRSRSSCCSSAPRSSRPS